MIIADLFVICAKLDCMKKVEHEAEKVLDKGGIITVADFTAAWPGIPMASVYSRIRTLLQAGRLSQVGRGQYEAIRKPVYSIPVTDWMLEVNRYLIDTCEGINHCLIQRGSNLYVEAAKQDLPIIYNQLKDHYPKVILYKDANRFPSVLEGYIMVGHLVSDSPIEYVGSLAVPTLEKQLVDGICNKKSSPMAFQKAMEVYPINLNRMRRYASRRGVAKELSNHLAFLNQERIRMFGDTQKFLATIPVQRAWVFGSFARGEETPDSDLDLLVDYDKSNKLSLLDVVRFKLDLEKILGREVDLVENGYLKPFALPSAERDKYLIYER